MAAESESDEAQRRAAEVARGADGGRGGGGQADGREKRRGGADKGCVGGLRWTAEMRRRGGGSGSGREERGRAQRESVGDLCPSGRGETTPTLLQGQPGNNRGIRQLPELVLGAGKHNLGWLHLAQRRGHHAAADSAPPLSSLRAAGVDRGADVGGRLCRDDDVGDAALGGRRSHASLLLLRARPADDGAEAEETHTRSGDGDDDSQRAATSGGRIGQQQQRRRRRAEEQRSGGVARRAEERRGRGERSAERSAANLRAISRRDAVSGRAQPHRCKSSGAERVGG